MFRIESYVTPILLNYVDEYVRDFKPADAQVSLWDGGVLLHNLVLKTEVLQKVIPSPFTLVSGRIHELLISVPWTKIMSEPIVVTIDTIECILGHITPDQQERTPQTKQSSAAVVEAPPGYMQALVRRIVSNICLKVHHLIVKYVQDDIVLSLNVKHLSVHSTGPDWIPTFADIDQTLPIIRRLVKLDNLTLCLDQCDNDGKIRYYQEPLLYRCQVDIRVFTRLVSANVRRASHLCIQIFCTKLAWGITSDQLLLLMRMLEERNVKRSKSNLVHKMSSAASNLLIQSTPTSDIGEMEPSQNTTLVEPVTGQGQRQSQGWAEWAWSWLPSSSYTSNSEETPVHSGPIPLQVSVYSERLTLSLKVMEFESSNRKRPRPILECAMEHLAVKSFILKPTKLKVIVGMRDVMIMSQGKCVCGHFDWYAAVDQSTQYLLAKEQPAASTVWTWPKKEFEYITFESREIPYDEFSDVTPLNLLTSKEEEITLSNAQEDPIQSKAKNDAFWELLDPIISIEFSHERSPPNTLINPYENIPKNFEYSDWVEDFLLTINIKKPLVLRICTGILHRVDALIAVMKDYYVHKEKKPRPVPTRTLTIEECEALMENLPQRRINIIVSDLSVHFYPWDHSLTEKPEKEPVVVEVAIKESSLTAVAPLYSYRVCSAVCQIPVAPDILAQETKLRTTVMLPNIEFNIFSLKKRKSKPCGRADLQLVINYLLHRDLFPNPENVTLSFTTKIKEANVCGSAARFLSVYYILLSLFRGKYLPILKMTSLLRDAIKDEKAIAVDLSFEDSFGRGFITRSTITHIFKLHSIRMTALQSHKDGVNQAWILAAPDVQSSTPFFRSAIQWCNEEMPESLDFFSIWTEPWAICLDPLLLGWLAYFPRVKENFESQPNIPQKKIISSTLYFSRRSFNLTSSSGRGASRSGSGVELVHSHARSTESGSSDFKKTRSSEGTAKKQWVKPEELLRLQERIKHMLVTVELGTVVVYSTMTTATAVNCSSLRSAMELHAASHRVLVMSLGRWSIYSNVLTKRLWEIIRYDRPTFFSAEEVVKPEAFPWKLKFADVTFYVMEIRAKPEYTGSLKALRSRLKAHIVFTRTILELVTTTVTVSFVSKKIKFTQYLLKPRPKSGVTITSASTPEDYQYKYFSSGTVFKPTTLKEFIRGPENVQGRGKTDEKEEKSQEKDIADNCQDYTSQTKEGPVTSVGFNLYAETQPIVIKLESDQLYLIASTIHCIQHLVNLIEQSPFIVPIESPQNPSSRSLDEEYESEDSDDTQESELVPIFQANKEREEPPELSKFFYFQWVVNKVTVIATIAHDKLVLEIEDAMCSIDLQSLYNQAKIKMTSAFIKTYQQTENEEWEPGVLGGRVLETRGDGTNQEEVIFLLVTITQARIADLPFSWKEELHPKLLEDQKSKRHSMWEIFITMAPLEVLLDIQVIENLYMVLHGIIPDTHCLLKRGSNRRQSHWQWPYFYLILGGLRAIVHGETPAENAEDTLILSMIKTSITPLPDNPICRRTINSSETTVEGFQYELKVKSFTLQTAHYHGLMEYEANRSKEEETSQENPATKWTSQSVEPKLTSIILPVNISAIYAPPHYVGNVLTGGPALEINLLSDCVIELSIEQILLFSIMVSKPRIFASAKKSKLNIFDSSSVMDDFMDEGICLYRDLLDEVMETPSDSDSSVEEEDSISQTQFSNLKAKQRDLSEDSGVDTTSLQFTSRLKQRLETRNANKKRVSYVPCRVNLDPSQDPMNYLEVFITTGVIDVMIEANNDGSPYVVALKPPESEQPEASESNLASKHKQEPSKVKLFYAILHQPNVYFWMNKTQKTLQFSIFNLTLGLGGSPHLREWHSEILSTATGQLDPNTDICPALATLKLILPNDGHFRLAARGSFNLDIERPVLFHVDTDKIKRIILLKELFDQKFEKHKAKYVNAPSEPILPIIKRLLFRLSIGNVTVRTSQMGITGIEGVVGWDSASLQVALKTRPDRLLMRSLITAAVITVGGPNEQRVTVMLPLYIGAELDCVWESWCRAVQRRAYPGAVITLHIEFDHLVFDICPKHVASIIRVQNAIKEALETKIEDRRRESNLSVEEYPERSPRFSVVGDFLSFSASMPRQSIAEPNGEYLYQDDLRSGAFKIIKTACMPMAYQVTVYGSAVTWAYPHPRTITRLVAYPLPGQNEEVDCVLELFNSMQKCWEPHTYFSIPVNEEREIHLYVAPPEAAFATIWRYRSYDTTTEKKTPHSFNGEHYMPCEDPFKMLYDEEGEYGIFPVSAEELSGVLRVDSYFAPHLMPGLHLNVILNKFQFSAYNSILPLSDDLCDVKGYYASKSLMRSHRFLTATIHQGTLYGEFGSPTGTLLLFKSQFSSDLLNCNEQIMEEFIDKFDVQAGISILPEPREVTRTRFYASSIRVSFDLRRLQTLKAVTNHWIRGIDQALRLQPGYVSTRSDKELQLNSLEAFEGWVAHWIHNTSAESLRIGQVGTDEDMPLPSGVRLAYNWRSPHAEKKIRFALNRPTTEWRWSDGIDFNTEYSLVKLTSLPESPQDEHTQIELHILNRFVGAVKCMRVGGRLVFANMLRFPLTYKIRASNSKYWKGAKSLAAGELPAESIVPSYLCEIEADIIVKIKFATQNASWSGDIPLKECPKKNIPWLVKVPCEGDIPYISVWCRISQSEVTARVLITFWPLYMLQSRLTQDIDVMVVSENQVKLVPDKEEPKGQSATSTEKSAPLLQGAQGRGAFTHLQAPGTTTARHSLTFQYRHLDCPVTGVAVDLHYGMSEVTVFPPVPKFTYLYDILEKLRFWIKKSKNEVECPWPYSLVTKHYQGSWLSALLQPRCDINVTYEPLDVGGGCSLILVLSPVVLLCNASPITLTLRAHDAAPLCKIEPGNVISPASVIVNKPFFLSVEVTRETFVSQQLELYKANPGPYTELPPGQVAVDHPATFAIQCNNKVAFLTLYYEVKNQINVFGVSSTFWIKNNLPNNLLVSAMTTIHFPGKEKSLIAKGFTLLQPTEANSMNGVALCKFRLRDRWHGTDENELNTFICLSITSNNVDTLEPDSAVVPVRVTKNASKRTAITLFEQNQSVPVVVTQQKHEGRWMIIVSPDPCPQYVVHNGTNHRIAIAEPVRVSDLASLTNCVEAVPNCYGIRWTCIIKPNSVTHYTTPSYSSRHPSADDTKHLEPMLIFSRVKGEDDVTWSTPVVIEDGEQLLQLHQHPNDFTVKLTICLHPHSTLIDIEAVNQTDIAASDIRRRITRASLPQALNRTNSVSSAQTSDLLAGNLSKLDIFSGVIPARIEADQQLLHKPLQLKKSKVQQDHSVEICSLGDLPKYISIDNVKMKVEIDKDKLESKAIPSNNSKDNFETKTVPINTSEDNLETNAIPTNKDKLETKAVPIIISKEKLESKTVPAIISKDKLETKVVSSNIPVDKFEAIVSEAFPCICEVKPCQDCRTECRCGGTCSLGNPSDEAAAPREINPSNASNEGGPSDENLNPPPNKTKLSTQYSDGAPKNSDKETSPNEIKPSTSYNEGASSNSDEEAPSNKIKFHKTSYTEIIKNVKCDETVLKDRSHTSNETTNPDDLVVIQSWHSADHASFIIRKSFLVTDLLRGLFESIVIEVAVASREKPLFALFFDRAAFMVSLQETRKDVTVSVADVQMDNLHYDEGMYDFAVVATTRSTPFTASRMPALWNMFSNQEAFEIKEETARTLLRVTYDTWTVAGYDFTQLTEVSVRAGPVALYLEDEFIQALVKLYRTAIPPTTSNNDAVALSEAKSLRRPLVLRLLNIDPIDLTLTIHTAVRMYIALDHSPLRLGPFKREHIMMSPERLAHNLTVHYLSAVILSAGWVVGGLELLGAPGAFAARVGGATGGVREFATTAAAAMIRSMSALARSLARNLDLLAGDEEHAMRAAAARRCPPDSFLSGLITGLANFAINILGAVGGLAHHPLVGPAVGESQSSAMALRRSVVGALAKPLSATADLFAYAGHGLLNQAGWELVPQPRTVWTPREGLTPGWQRDCVRWTFRLADMLVISGVFALYNNAPVQLLVTHKYLVVVEFDTENIMEMIDLRLCHLRSYQGNIIELEVQSSNKQSGVSSHGPAREEEEANHMTAAALSRLARYTGSEEQSERRVLQLLPASGLSYSLHATLAYVIHSNSKTHFAFL